MKKSAFALIAVVTLLGVVSCEEKVELNAPYQSDTVVFGILDPAVDTQWVRINRTWLGDSNNLDAAAIRDSSEYPVDAFVGEVRKWTFGTQDKAWELQSVERQDKDDNGIFFGPAYTAYYFVPDEELSPNAEYEIYLEFTDGRTVYSSTNIIEEVTGAFSAPQVNTAFGWGFGTSTGQYNDFNCKWTSSENAKLYELSLDIYYTEYTYTDETLSELVSTELKTLNWSLGSEVSEPSDPFVAEQMSREINGEQFFSFLDARLNAPNKRYEIGRLGNHPVNGNPDYWWVTDVVLTMGNEELYTYIEVTSPVTGIIQERPEYTNVNNGLGLWASRRQIRVNKQTLSLGSTTEVFSGEYTADNQFCSPVISSDWACP